MPAMNSARARGLTSYVEFVYLDMYTTLSPTLHTSVLCYTRALDGLLVVALMRKSRGVLHTLRLFRAVVKSLRVTTVDTAFPQQRQRLVVLPAIKHRRRQRYIEPARPDRMAVGAPQRVPVDGLDPTGPLTQKATLRPAIVLRHRGKPGAMMSMHTSSPPNAGPKLPPPRPPFQTAALAPPRH